LVPIEPKVTAFDGEIGRHGQFLARAQAEQRTVCLLYTSPLDW